MSRFFILLAGLVLFTVSCTPAAPEKLASQQSHNPADLLNKTWLWESTVTPVERISVASPEHYTIRFADAGELQAKFDCNSGGGNYTLTEGHVSIGPLRSTRKACPEGTQDFVFMRDIQRVSSFFLQDGQLFLELPLDSGIMKFRGMP